MTDRECDYSLVIPGEPEAQERPRFTIMNRKGVGIRFPDAQGELYYRKEDLWVHVYDPSKLRKAATRRWICKLDPLLTGPLRVDVFLYFAYLKEHYRTGKYAGQLKQNAQVWKHTGKDRDNCDKFILDVLTGWVFVNDSQVSAGEIQKRYDKEPRTEIYITQLRSSEDGEERIC